ncbi:hypothetical protein Y1Q_0015800 [Alligator mississippiensis]|uniref:Reverse transcriptase domain-containing protein n=1 Tax=Alligator mississippiensis TaxID=8496 RepID=A0A151N0V7_ALLMI|nr:hypothetical protein Y1Q_0015800 [Alligator mississippiensis]
MAVYHQLKAQVQQCMRDTKNNWWVKKAHVIQGYADHHDMCNFFRATKTIYRPCSIGYKALQSQNDSWLLKDEDSIRLCWKEHFKLFFNWESTISEETLQAVQQCRVVDFFGDPPTIRHLKWAIQQMKTNKACGPDGIPAEVYHADGFWLTSQLHQIVLYLWDEEDISRISRM